MATATAPGGARGLIRLSGPAAAEIARRLTDGALPARRTAAVAIRLPTGSSIPAEAIWMPAPRSYTGEDTVEWSLPGAAALLDAAVEAMVAAGARQAGPGEFTLRAYLNGRLDLAQAEAVAAVIEAADRPELRAAHRALHGQLSRTLRSVESGLLDLCADVEAAIDFVDQDIELIAPDAIAARARAAQDALSALRVAVRTRRPAGTRPRAMLLGPANAGKTTLFNALTGDALAIVSPVRGTTRDLLSTVVRLGGSDIELVDSPGIDDGPDEGAAARRAIEQAPGSDLILLVAAADQPLDEAAWTARLPPGVPVVRVRSKSDLAPAAGDAGGSVAVSALRGDGLDALMREIARALAGNASADGAAAVTARQMTALHQANDALERAQQPGAALEILAADLRTAASALGALTGRDVTDDVLGRIFERFCIGK